MLQQILKGKTEHQPSVRTPLFSDMAVMGIAVVFCFKKSSSFGLGASSLPQSPPLRAGLIIKTLKSLLLDRKAEG